LAPASNLIKDFLEFQKWHRDGDNPKLLANRLVLPAVGHYDQVAAFICTELLRNGADTDLLMAFRHTEPIVEMAIRRLRLTDQALLGLAGELIVMDALVKQIRPEGVASIVRSWDGWKESLRDFSWADTGVEVKTTTLSTSSHMIEGVHQVELRSARSLLPENRLYLVSLGLQWVSHAEGAFSIPSLVDSIISRVGSQDNARDAPALIDLLISRIHEYGSGAEIGYDHRTMRSDPVFSRPFVARFVRGYDMLDEKIRIIRSPDIAPHVHVDSSSLSYRLELPSRVSGDLNPVVGLQATARLVLNMFQ
jgi:hypothetical protein